MNRKQCLFDLFDLAGGEMQAFGGRLSPEALQASGTLDRWAPKENVAHIAIWQERLLERVKTALKGGEPPCYDNYLELNDQDFARCRQMTWQESRERAVESFQALRAQLAALSESDLERLDLYPGQERPLWRTLVGVGVEHVTSHLALVYSQHGLAEEAIRLQEHMSEATLKLDESPAWQGTVHYNLACVLALAGRKEQALARLKEALRLNPSLTEWSQQDSDLDSLRQEEGYKALYQAG